MKCTLSVFTCLLFILTYCQNALSQEVIARWGDSPQISNTNIIHASSGNSINIGTASLERKNDENKISFSTDDNGFPDSNVWDETRGKERYWLVSFSTEGYGQISLTFRQKGSPTGPKNFSIEYITGEEVWQHLYKAISIPQETWTKPQTIDLPSKLENQTKVSLRWIVNDEQAINGKDIGSGGLGTNRLDLTISGIADNSINSSIQNHPEQHTEQNIETLDLRIIDGKIWIQNTTSDPIKNVYCYTLQGQALPVNIEKQMDSFCVDVPEVKPEVIIIQVISEKNTLTKKIVL